MSTTDLTVENLRLKNAILLQNLNESIAGRPGCVPPLTGNTVPQGSPESAKSGSRMDVAQSVRSGSRMDVEFQESPESSKSGSTMDIAHSVRSVSFMDVAESVRILPHTVTDSSVATDSADVESEPNTKIGPG